VYREAVSVTDEVEIADIPWVRRAAAAGSPLVVRLKQNKFRREAVCRSCTQSKQELQIQVRARTITGTPTSTHNKAKKKCLKNK
jgi:hypothetical protein